MCDMCACVVNSQDSYALAGMARNPVVILSFRSQSISSGKQCQAQMTFDLQGGYKQLFFGGVGDQLDALILLLFLQSKQEQEPTSQPASQPACVTLLQLTAIVVVVVAPHTYYISGYRQYKYRARIYVCTERAARSN
ncbi:hypothetical protein GQX74_004425 [Glossina fuscipes]|nr:hypothetical protein GQX74_004425 [Glossina fuscipes]